MDTVIRKSMERKYSYITRVSTNNVGTIVLSLWGDLQE